MGKLAVVFRHEYRRHALRPGFLFSVFGLPLLVAALLGLVLLILNWGANRPVGVVDLLDLVPDAAAYSAAAGAMPLRDFAAEEAARAALAAGEIQAFLVLDESYLSSGTAPLYFESPPGEGVYATLRTYVRSGWLADSDPAVAARFAGGAGYQLEFVSLREDGSGESLLAFLLPYAVGMIFYFAIFTTAGYLLQSVVDEKENRTLEIVITSLSPERFMTGKILGLVAVGLTQIGVWLGGGAAIFWLLQTWLPALQGATAAGGIWLVGAAWFLPYYLFVSTLIAAIGVSVANVGEAQQMVGFISIAAVTPLGLIFLFVLNPDSVLSVALTLLPLTSPFVLLMRWQVTTVPLWQMLLSWLLLGGATALSVYATGRLLHRGMLRSGQRLTLAEVAIALRPWAGQRR